MTDPGVDRVDRRARLSGRLLLAFTLAYALVVQSLAFHRSADIRGDLAYHRGVAYSMVGGDLNGQGPIHHLLSYFGGLFPMTLGYGAHLFGVSFDSFVSVVSWPAGLALPLALWWLGRRIWADDLTPALLAFLGTVSGPLGSDPAARWVRSVLPSGANFWPIYPRDVGLVLVILTVAMVYRAPRAKSTVAGGVLAAIALCVQVQFGFYAIGAGVATIGWIAWGTTDRRRAIRRAVPHAIALGTVALVASAWWWWPRLLAYLDSDHLLLKSFPGNTDPPATLFGLIGAFGLLGILGAVGMVIALRRGRASERFFALWLAAFVPIAGAGLILGDTGVLTGRRALFLASIPLAVCATVTVKRLTARIDLRIVVPLLVVVITIPGIFEARWIDRRVSAAWTAPVPPDPFAASTWGPTLSALRDRVEAHGADVVLAPDNDAEFIWEHSGAQPTSLWLPGWVKLGFPLRPTTGTSYLPRVRAVQRAFAGGAPALCALARRTHAQHIVLRRSADGIALYDVHPSAQWRVDPAERSERTVHRSVGPAVTYLDVNEDELLNMGRGGGITIDWKAPEIRSLQIEFRPRPGDATPPPVEVALSDGTKLAGTFTDAGPGWVIGTFATPNGIPSGFRITALGRMTFDRVQGYVPSRSFSGTASGPVTLSRRALCALPASG